MKLNVHGTAELADRGLEPAFAEEAPGTRDVGPDVDLDAHALSQRPGPGAAFPMSGELALGDLENRFGHGIRRVESQERACTGNLDELGVGKGAREPPT